MTTNPPFLPQGTVYGTLLNFRHERAVWAARMSEPPYQAPPRTPVLYIKTANTFSPSGATIALPASVPEVEVGASVGLVIGELMPDQGKVLVDRPSEATNSGVIAGVPVAGLVLLDDLSLPHASYYRPPVKFKCLDGFLGVGAECVPLATDGDPAALVLEVRINGEHRQSVDFSGLVRDAATLLADVSAFMTLQPGDVLMLGTDCLEDGSRPRVKAGDSVEITATGFAPLVNHFVGEDR